MTTKTSTTKVTTKTAPRYTFSKDAAGALAQHVAKAHKTFQVTDVAQVLSTTETLKAKVFQAAAKRVVRRWVRRGIVKAVRAA